MNVLEKILEEIENLNYYPEGMGCGIEDCGITDIYEACEYGWNEAIEAVIEVINNMDDGKGTNVPSNWISVEERLPEAGELVKVTVHSSEWISDYNSDWVSEEDKIHYPAEYNVYDGFLCRDEAWIFYDKYNEEVTCVKEFGIDKGRGYDVVTAWMPIILPEPYKGGKENE